MTYNDDRVLKLVEGSYDLHVHPNPDTKVRGFDDFELLHEMDEFKMAGAVLKLQNGESAERVWIANKYAGAKAKLYSSLVLCNALGGLNPDAVEMGVKMGIKTFWMPTRNAALEMASKVGHYDGMILDNVDGTLNPEAERMLKNQGVDVQWPPDCMSDYFVSYRPGDPRRPSNKGLYILDEYGMLKPEIYDILDIAKANDLVVNTGHMSLREIITFCRAAREMDVKVIMTHPEYIVPVEVQCEMAKLGVFIEKIWAMTIESYSEPQKPRPYCITVAEMADQIRKIGPGQVILGTDAAEPSRATCPTGMYLLIDGLLKNGISDADIRHMGTDVAKYLLNIN